VPVVLHTDHAAKKLLPWVDGLLDAGEKYFEQHKEPLFSSHMLDLSEEPLAENAATSKRYLERMAKMGMGLEVELGVTGGEEDGVDNSGVDNARLYTQPADVLAVYDALETVGLYTVAASFGNTHGVYKPGNVKLTPKILDNSQKLIAEKRSKGAKPVSFVFHGGSGSSVEEIREAVSYGVVKMNIDTDTQWAFCKPIKKYMDEKSAYLQDQLGNRRAPTSPTRSTSTPAPGCTWARRACATAWCRPSSSCSRPANSSSSRSTHALSGSGPPESARWESPRPATGPPEAASHAASGRGRGRQACRRATKSS
jgi:fructose-bisphosphate aldolase class II